MARLSPDRVLVIEDAPDVRIVLRAALEGHGFEVHEAADGEEGLRIVADLAPDVVLLDLGLPGIDGFEVCRRLRAAHPVPIMMLTARDDDVDAIVGLEVGADDYVTKPCSPRVLVARIRALLRRSRDVGSSPTDLREHGPLRVDLTGREVTVDGSPVTLTRTEFDLLARLTANPRKVYPRKALLEEVWGPGYGEDGHLLEVHVSNLRRKLGTTGLIQTVRGVGYKMGGPSTPT